MTLQHVPPTGRQVRLHLLPVALNEFLPDRRGGQRQRLFPEQTGFARLRHSRVLSGGGVVPRSRPAHRNGNHGGTQPVQRPQILNAQRVIGARQQGGLLPAQQFLNGPLAAGRKGGSALQAPAKTVLPGRTGQGRRHLPQSLQVSAFAAEGDGLHNSGALQESHGPPGKRLGGGAGPGRRQFQHQIHSAPQGQAGPEPLVRQRGRSLLHPVAAEHGGHRPVPALRVSQPLPGGADLQSMAAVEGVIFGCNPKNMHGDSLQAEKQTFFRIPPPFPKKTVVLKGEKR